MFCPECEAEYRAGCARCSDCDVALVEHLKDTDVPSSNPELSGTPALLWTGTDSETRAGIIEALETAKISYHTRSDKVGALRNWPQQVYAIFTHARDQHAARAALEAAARRRETAADDSDQAPPYSNAPPEETSANDDGDDASDLPLDYVPEDFDPADATAEVWSGQDTATRENLINCLGNIGIGSTTEDSAGQLRIRVTPSSQKRAQEMVRQITDASAAQ